MDFQHSHRCELKVAPGAAVTATDIVNNAAARGDDRWDVRRKIQTITRRLHRHARAANGQ